jgi:hypothetical protein
MLDIRSFSVAAYLAGHGHAPLDYDTESGSFFSTDAAKPTLDAYRRTMADLSAVVARAKEGAK